ncbi:cilia- and flagella-associated protein 52 [Panulirus ornatus]|uniref:cilia- and flagella-associated protein 52 n=1 Tax=Panulirus ornatus TaxID=150431 RepID=UPI003A88D52A
MMKTTRKTKELQLLSAIGFTGKVVGGLHLQEDNGLVYPVGVGVGVWDRSGGRHAILNAHNRPVTALAVSRSGRVIVSAQNSDPGCQAKVVVWTYRDRRQLGSYTVHREEVAAVAVTSGDEAYVVSLGGVPDGYLVVWHIPTRRPLCSAMAAEPGLGTATLLCTAPYTPTLMVVGGQRRLRTWTLNPESNRLTPTSISLGLLERNYTCLQVDEREEYLFAATTTGDVVKVRLNTTQQGVAVLESVMAPRSMSGSTRLSRAPTPGIQTLFVLPGGDLLVGDMGGTVRAYRQVAGVREDERAGPPRAHGTVKYTHPKDPSRPLLMQLWEIEVGAGITSLSMVGRTVAVGTVNSEIYELTHPAPEGNKQHPSKLARLMPNNPKKNRAMDENKVLQYRKQRDENRNKRQSGTSKDILELVRLESTPPEVQLLSTCHSEPIYDVTFPRGVGELVVSAGMGGVRVWNVRSLEEVLRVELPGLVCCCCCVTPTLHTIVTGWSDGRLRGLGAESGRVLWTVDDAHHGSVNAVITVKTSHTVSGGRDGRVRVWLVEGSTVHMVATQKEHRGEVTHLALAPSHTRVLSCSGDGSCILWQLPELERIYSLTAHTVFLGGCVLSREEMATVGSDGSVLVWDRDDGALLADLPASTRPITTITVTSDDTTLVTAGEDAVIKVWNWSKGRVTHEGRGHSGAVTRVSLSPDGHVLASVGKDGALLFWKIP